MEILPCRGESLKQAQALVKSVFRWMSPIEGLSFLLITHPRSRITRLLKAVSGIKDVVAFDVSTDVSGRVLGTTGLYRYNRDAAEAVWVAWLCVDPNARGRGIGQALIDHTIKTAQSLGYQKIRLYTSTAPNEAAAQLLYEKNGFAQVGCKKGLFTTTLFREKIIMTA